MCIRIYIFDFKKQTNKQKTKNTKNVQETKEEKRISPETSISENKSFCLFVCYFFQGWDKKHSSQVTVKMKAAG